MVWDKSQMESLKKLVKKFIYFLWIINGYVGVSSHLSKPQKASVLIAYYNPIRLEHINHQIRNLLLCDFIERIIISNHNPDVEIESVVKINSEILILLNQNNKRGCGYRWLVADRFSPEYLIVLDDDILLFPRQIRRLFEFLIKEPEFPHGLAGMMHHREDGSFEYYQKSEQTVDYLCEVYAITGKHLKRYIRMINDIRKNKDLEKVVEFAADFVVIGHTGEQRPQIHKVGHLLRCPTFNKEGIAVHRDPAFIESVNAVALVLDSIKENTAS